MKHALCEKLDDYMLGWLSADEAAEFERHLADCSACRREIALQQSIDGLLAKAHAELDATPADLIERAKNRVQKTHRHKAIRWTLSLTAAAVVLLFAVFGRSMFHNGGAENQEIDVANNLSESPEKELLPPPFRGLELPTVSTRVKLADPSSGIVLECKTKDPKINIVWIYPAVQATAELDE